MKDELFLKRNNNSNLSIILNRVRRKVYTPYIRNSLIDKDGLRMNVWWFWSLNFDSVIF